MKKKTKKRKATKRPRKSPKKPKLISKVVRVKKVIVRYGGVIKTGSFENRRVSYEVEADVLRGANIKTAFNYVESIAVNQFNDAQISVIDELPQPEQKKLSYIKGLPKNQGVLELSKYFKDIFTNLTEEQKRKRLVEIEIELKELAPAIRDENARLKKLQQTKKGVGGKDLHKISDMKTRMKDLKAEIKKLKGE